MKAKLIISMAAILLVYAAAAFAISGGTNTSLNLTGGGLSATEVPPMVFIDGKARLWQYNDTSTKETAELYGVATNNSYGYNGTLLPLRQHYAFQGETVQYFVVAMDGNGVTDIASLNLYVQNSSGNTTAGNCTQVQDFANTSAFKIKDYQNNPIDYTNLTMGSYVCNLTVMNESDWKGKYTVFIQANDSLGNTSEIKEADSFFFNPSIDVELTNGPVTFGRVAQGTTAMSHTIYIENMDTGLYVVNSSVLLDMYISSDPYFTDPGNSTAACPTTSGMPYTALSYYATKGSINSGVNNNDYPGLGISDPTTCIADTSGFTQLVPESSSNVSNMCRIINWDMRSSILAQGSEMSLTFKAELPSPCVGSYTNGQFYFIGEVI